MQVALAITYHDPQGELEGLVNEQSGLLGELFAGMAVQASRAAPQRVLNLFANAGARVVRDDEQDLRPAALSLGRKRAGALRLALALGAPYVLAIDGDQVLHWAAAYPQELRATLARLNEADFTVLGRAARALASHPHALVDTETPVNRLFSAAAGVSGVWDVMKAARGISRDAGMRILAGCPDEAISVDVSWPLFLLKNGQDRLAYLEVEGLEFETGDRYAAEVAQCGGTGAWLAQVDADPREWAHRFHLARLHCEAIEKYRPNTTTLRAPA